MNNFRCYFTITLYLHKNRKYIILLYHKQMFIIENITKCTLCCFVWYNTENFTSKFKFSLQMNVPCSRKWKFCTTVNGHVTGLWLSLRDSVTYNTCHQWAHKIKKRLCTSIKMLWVNNYMCIPCLLDKIKGDIPMNTAMITTFMIKIKCNWTEFTYSSQSLICQCQTCNIKLNGLKLKNNLVII